LPIQKPEGDEDSYSKKNTVSQIDRKMYNLYKHLKNDEIKTAIKSRIIC
jgi:hypothetical protein